MPSLRDSVRRLCSPGTYVPGFHIPPLRGWGHGAFGASAGCGRLGIFGYWLVVEQHRYRPLLDIDTPTV
jgi:hypothetical protein